MLKNTKNSWDSILDYVDHLKKAKIQGIEPYEDLIGSKNVFREDKSLTFDPETNPRLLKEVPEKYDRFIKTKNPLQ